MSLRGFAKRLRREEERPDVIGAGLFDLAWYELQRDRSFADDRAALENYLREGRVRGFSPHPLFEPAWYRPKDWRTADEDPLLTYVRDGGSPHPAFDEARYVLQHPNARRHPGGALGHFLASATPQRPVPASPDVPWGTLRSVLVAAQGLWVEHERAVGPANVGPPEEAAVAALLSWAGAVPLPDVDPLVTVVLPVRNRATHLVAAIASVRQQSFPGWELVVVNDGSTDATARVLELLADGDPRIRVITHAPSGSSAARNAGIQAAAGLYVAFLDADEVWAPEHLRIALATLVSRPCSAVHAMTRRWSRGIAHAAFPADPRLLVHRNHVSVSALVVERQVLHDAGGFDAGLPRFAEQDLGIKLAQATTIVPIDYVAVTNYQDPSLTDRASLTEPTAWTEVVTDRQEFDWPRLTREVDQRSSDLTILVPDVLGWRAALATVRSALDSAPDVEVVVAHGGGTRFDWTMLVAQCPAEGVRLFRTPVPRSLAFLTNLAFAHSSGRTAVVLPAGTTVAQGSLQRLAETLHATGAAAVRPTIRGLDASAPALPGLTVSARSLADARGFDVLSTRGQETERLLQLISPDGADAVALTAEVEVELTKRARAAYAPSAEGDAGD